MTDPSLIILFVKAPAPGKVKSRLAADLGEETALELYRCFVGDTMEMIERTGLPFVIFFHPPGARVTVSRWLGEQRTLQPQQGGDLGERMEQAFRAVFAEGCTRAVLIGSDVPDLPPGVLRDAFDGLERNDAVIGPAADGGYYCIGFRRDSFDPGIFHGIAWSSPGVYAGTMDLFGTLHRSVHVLPAWRDNDTVDDLRDLAARNRGTAFSSSRTIRLLAALKERSGAGERFDVLV